MAEKIKKIMEKSAAIEILDDIKNKIYDVDLDALCGDVVDVSPEKQNGEVYTKLIQGIMCGLVSWDEEEKCIVQKLIRPLKSGDQTADKLYYKNQLKLGDTKDFNAKNQSELSIQALATVCSRSNELVSQLSGQDLTIAVGCLGFFDK